MGAITGARSAILSAQPVVEEAIGGIEIFADGAVIRFSGDGLITTVIHYVERSTPLSITRHEVCRIHFPYPSWQGAMNRTMDMLRKTLGVH